ncbi:hypothetical protein [Mycobacterium sp.]|uniref:hypothetical protein n=1 Tax=Mycobacterium sp. TaxID=1785 RepID=UPI003A8B598E
MDTMDETTIFEIGNRVTTDTDGELIYVDDLHDAKPEIKLLDHSYVNLVKTMRLSTPKIVLRTEEGSELRDLEQKEDKADQLIDSSLIQIEAAMTIENGSDNVSIYQPNTQMIADAMKSFKDSFAALLYKAGFAGADDTDSAQKSVLEVSQIRDSELASMEDKISLFQANAKRFLRVLGKLLGLEIDHKDGIEIQRLDVKEEIDMIDNLIKAVEAGFEERTAAIARYKGISYTEAKSVREIIDDEKESVKQNMEDDLTEETLEDDQKPIKGTARRLEE